MVDGRGGEYASNYGVKGPMLRYDMFGSAELNEFQEQLMEWTWRHGSQA